jgi:ATP-dependent DNA helicase RecG
LEFKQSFNRNEVSETLSAMANRNGGAVLIGVTNKAEIKGVQLGKETLQEWLNQIGQITEPKLIPNISEEKIKDKIVVRIEIAPYPISRLAVLVGVTCV